MHSRLFRGIVILAVGTAIWFSPYPADLNPDAWHLLAIFIAVIPGFIFKPMPIGAVAFTGITFCALSGTLKPTEALSGFSNTTIWLIVTSFLLSRAFVKTGLGKRIAYLIVRTIGDKTLKLSYAMILSDWVLAPITPSNTARAESFFLLYAVCASCLIPNPDLPPDELVLF